MLKKCHEVVLCDGREQCARVVELEQERRERIAETIDMRARLEELEERLAAIDAQSERDYHHAIDVQERAHR